MYQPRLFPLVVLACAAGCAAAALPDKPVLKDYSLPQTDFSRNLKSGLRVLVQEDHSSPTVTVVAAYGVGSTSDPKGVEGLAHFVEHLAFRTKFEDGVPIWDHLKRLGVDFNATTSWDWTMYFGTAPKENLERMLQIEAWRLARMMNGVTQEVFDIEREVVRNERRLGGETQGSRAIELVAAAMFPPGHPLSRSNIGSHQSLSAASLEHAREFTRKHYRPENCTIIIAGDVDPKQVAKLLGQWPEELLFGPGGQGGPAVPPRKPVPDVQLPVPPPANKALVRERGPVPQSQLLLAWSAPGGYRRNDALLQFTAARLELALSEGLEFKEDDDIEGVSTGVLSFIPASILVVQANLKRGADAETARQRVMDALVNAWASELGRMQTMASRWFAGTDLLLASGDPVGSAVALAQHLAATGSNTYYKDTMDDLAKIEPGQVMELAHKYLHRDRTVSVLVEPEAEEAPRSMGGGSATGTGPVKTEGHDVGRDNLTNVGDLGPARILQVARSPGLAALPRWKLPNGLEVVAMKHGSAPVARIVVGIKGGDATTTPYGLGSWAALFSTTKCSDHGSLSPVGGRHYGSGGQLRTTRTVEVLSGNLANGMAVLSDHLACREVDQEMFLHMRDRALERAIRSYERSAKMPDFQANTRLWSVLYPQHPLGMVTVDPATFKNVSYDDAAAYMRAHYRPGNATAVVVGDVDPGEARSLAEKYLGRWTGGGGAMGLLPAPPPPPAARKVFMVDRPQGTQATVRIACRLTDATPEQLPFYDLVTELASARAWDVREKLGATYGIAANAVTRPGGSAHLIISGAIENRQVGPSLSLLLGILGELSSDKLDEQTFLMKRWDLARKFWQRFSDGQSVAAHILQASDHRWPNDVWDRYPERLAAAKRQDVSALFKNCVGREIITVSGKASDVRPQLEAAGLKVEAN